MSPHARGLRAVAEGGAEPLGIIPARAGFTQPHTGHRPGHGDHPRSRGVYPHTETPVWSAEGSSPLARGLPHPPSTLAHAGGIIPARAGFTIGEPAPSTRAWDHPRSRGVYRQQYRAYACSPGSSPLARGLRHSMRQLRDAERIIPARAGFTLGLTPLEGINQGSSPLARGLRRRGSGWPFWRGIIPARAGFTARPGTGTRCRADHPRSRGVYLTAISVAQSIRGSSPLARGLRRLRVFPSSRCSDHPRSRGVYMSACRILPRTGGSSPLARGLRASGVVMSDYFGIIPARAGFTLRRYCGRVILWDHPRSRGVYVLSGNDFYGSVGSSPLARGLPWNQATTTITTGIIPARAGFTRATRATAWSAPDHPRSRGVYKLNGGAGPACLGSSPLARGLQFGSGTDATGRGIIPARAGFTWRARTPSPSSPDHPRSRGVYAQENPLSASARGSSPLARGLPHTETPVWSTEGSSPLARGLRLSQAHCGHHSRIIPARAGFTEW